MLTLDKFIGINNVQPGHRLKSTELASATNVDIGLDGEIRRRRGYTQVSEVCHKNLWQAQGFMLATCNGDLVRTDGTTQAVLQESLGVDRVWYCNLPDGRTTFSNGLINGITDGVTAQAWGVPTPESVGAHTPVAGDLFPGSYRWAISYVRLADGLEGMLAYSGQIELETGGILLTGLPEEPGHKINVYLSNGEGFYFAGTTLGSSFSYLGANNALTLPAITEHAYPMPVGTVTAFWRGRVLVAQGNILWASLPHQWEHCNLRRDFKQFSAPITLVQPVDGGVFVGTEQELAFLGGQQWDQLAYVRKINGAVVLGSGVTVPGEELDASGDAMVCIADGGIEAGLGDGSTRNLADDRYTTAVTEVAATFREVDGIPQYIAIPL